MPEPHLLWRPNVQPANRRFARRFPKPVDFFGRFSDRPVVRSFARVAVAAVVLVAAPLSAAAQSTGRLIAVQGSVYAGVTEFAAKRTFRAIFGESEGRIFGGGGQVTIRRGMLRGVFAGVSVERFKDTGQRVFPFDNQVFPLGIADTVTITPALLTIGYKVGPFRRITPYGGGGVGSYRLEETSEFGKDDERVDERFTGYHVLAGVEVRIWRCFGAAGEVKWATVKDALSGGIARELGEHNLGGTTAVLKLLADW